VLHRHDGTLIKEATETHGMDPPDTLGLDTEVAHVFEPVEQRDNIGGRRRLRIVPQPCEPGASHLRIEDQQVAEHL
jgi:hypothetical protein